MLIFGEEKRNTNTIISAYFMDNVAHNAHKELQMKVDKF